MPNSIHDELKTIADMLTKLVEIEEKRVKIEEKRNDILVEAYIDGWGNKCESDRRNRYGKFKKYRYW